MTLPVSDLDLLFAGPVKVEGDADQPWTVSTAPLGQIRLETGAVGVGDPFTGGLSGPRLARQAPPGPVDVELSVVRLAPDHLRVAGARLRFSEAAVVQWVVATFVGAEDAEDPAYGVDAGTGCFVCATSAPQWDTEASSEVLLAAFDEDMLGCRHPDAPDHIATFSSGFGDGIYMTWWGLDTTGAPAQLVTDFEVLARPIWQSTEVPLPLARGALATELLHEFGVVLKRPFFSAATVSCERPRRVPRLRVGPSGGPWRHLRSAWHLSRCTWTLGATSAGEVLEVSISVGSRPARALN